MNLADLQRAFQQHLLQGDAAIEPYIQRTEQVPARVRLDVYADAYHLRLTDALAQNYPRLQQWLGEAEFSALARDYLAAHPSRHASVRWFGEGLGTYLAAQSGHSDAPWLADLASWEWAIAAAFDATDDMPLNAHALATIEPDQWPALRFGLHSSVQVRSMQTNAVAIFKALTHESPLPQPESLDRSQSWLIWRQDLSPHYRSLQDDEAQALHAVAARRTFEEICSVLGEWHDESAVPLRAAALLKIWIGDGMLTQAFFETPAASDPADD